MLLPAESADVAAACDERLQIGHDEAQHVEDQPGDHDPLDPGGGFVHGPLVPRHHADDQGDSRHGHCHNGGDSNDLTVDVSHNGGEPIPDRVRQHRRDGNDQRRRDCYHRPVGRLFLSSLLTIFTTSFHENGKAKRRLRRSGVSFVPFLDDTILAHSFLRVISTALPTLCHLFLEHNKKENYHLSHKNFDFLMQIKKIFFIKNHEKSAILLQISLLNCYYI